MWVWGQDEASHRSSFWGLKKDQHTIEGFRWQTYSTGNLSESSQNSLARFTLSTQPQSNSLDSHCPHNLNQIP